MDLDALLDSSYRYMVIESFHKCSITPVLQQKYTEWPQNKRSPLKIKDIQIYSIYSGTWELGIPKGLSKTVLNSEVVLFLRSFPMWWIDLGTEVAVLNSQGVPISQVVLKTSFTVCINMCVG